MKRIVLTMGLLFGVLVAGAVAAQTFPSKPIRIVVPSAAGGNSDVVARVIANELEKRIGQAVVIENRPGAGMAIAASIVAKAVPDGYTLYFAGALGPHPIFTLNNPVDAGREFAPVSNLLSFGSLVFLVRAGIPAKTFQELVAYSKANPGKLNYANVTPAQELSMAVLKHRTGLSITTIPYKIDPQVITAFKAGEADLAMVVGPAYLRHIQDGTVRALFVAGAQRMAVLPNVPTSAEAGVPGFEVAFNSGIWAPAGTPRETIQRLNAEANAAVKVPAVVARLRGLGAEPHGSTPEEQLRLFEADVRFFTEAAKLAGFQPR